MNENLEKITCDLYVDWSECLQNIPVTEQYFGCSNHLVFDDPTPIGGNEDEENT